MNSLQKLTVFFVLTLALIGLFQLYKRGLLPIAPSYEQLHAKLFSGIQEISPEQMTRLFPLAKQQPMLIEFQSKYCMDCQRMVPILSEFQSDLRKKAGKSGEIPVYKYDISLDRKKYPEIFNAFHPIMVPTLLFVAPGGQIRDVLYGYHPKPELESALQKIKPASSV